MSWSAVPTRALSSSACRLCRSLLFYFKETSTPQAGASGPGKLLSDVSRSLGGAQPGQVHFAPAMCDVKQLQQQLERKGARRLDVW